MTDIRLIRVDKEHDDKCLEFRNTFKLFSFLSINEKCYFQDLKYVTNNDIDILQNSLRKLSQNENEDLKMFKAFHMRNCPLLEFFFQV